MTHFTLRAYGLMAGLLMAATHASAQTSLFSYQGRLNDGTNPATGLYDLRFALFNLPASGAQQVGQIILPATGVTNGLFDVALDFGSSVFNGDDRWIEVSVRTNGNGAFSAMVPRQRIGSTPYAIRAGNATSVAAANITGVLHSSQLPFEVAYRDGGNLFVGDQFVIQGRVGIGTTTPNASLEVRGPSGTSARLTGPGGNGATVALDLATYDPAPEGSPNPAARLIAYDRNYSADVEIQTKAPGAASNPMVSRLRIDSATGAVGIGTTSPAGGLSVANALPTRTYSSYPQGIHLGGSISTDPNTAAIVLSGAANANGKAEIAFSTGVPGYWRTIGYTRQYDSIYISPNVGIGTANPVGQLEISNGKSSLRFLAGLLNGTPHQGGFTLSVKNADQPGANGILGIDGEIQCTAVNLVSDRNRKENFEFVDSADVLEKVTQISITKWQYKGADGADGVRHIGPMAQDFRAAFGLGRDDRSISSVDANGVALAAIQGLNQKVDLQAARIQELEGMIAELKALCDRVQQATTR